LSRYNRDGSLDATFGTGGEVSTTLCGSAGVSAAVVQADNKTLVSGIVFDGPNTGFANGTVDTSFGTGELVVMSLHGPVLPERPGGVRDGEPDAAGDQQERGTGRTGPRLHCGSPTCPGRRHRKKSAPLADLRLPG